MGSPELILLHLLLLLLLAASLPSSALRRQSSAQTARTWCAMTAPTAASTTVPLYARLLPSRSRTRRPRGSAPSRRRTTRALLLASSAPTESFGAPSRRRFAAATRSAVTLRSTLTILRSSQDLQ